MTSIRQTASTDRAAILAVHAAAFKDDKGPVISRLVNELLDDPTAEPYLSLAAFEQNRLVGHILFTTVAIDGSDTAVRARILAPLAVLPSCHDRGIGGLLVRSGLAMLEASGIGPVFVLGHPGYYPRFGFVPAGAQGFAAPYPIPEEHADAWMVTALQSGTRQAAGGTVRCANALQAPEHWRE